MNSAKAPFDPSSNDFGECNHIGERTRDGACTRDGDGLRDNDGLRVSATELERLVEGQLSDREYRRVVAQLEQEPDGWRRCCLAFLEHQALRSDLALMGGFPFDSHAGLQADDGTSGAFADHLLNGGLDEWSEDYSRQDSRSHRLGRRAKWLRRCLESPLKNPLGGFAVVIAASVLVYAAVNAGRERIPLPTSLSFEPSGRPGVEEELKYADHQAPSRADSVDSDRESTLSDSPFDERVQFAVVRSDDSSFSVPLDPASPSDSLRWPSRTVSGADTRINSSLDAITKPYRVQPRLFLSVLPDGQMGLIPVEVIRIKAYQ